MVTVALNHRELSVVLAGLRLLQEQRGLPDLTWDILTDCSSENPLKDDEINALCQRINFDGYGYDPCTSATAKE